MITKKCGYTESPPTSSSSLLGHLLTYSAVDPQHTLVYRDDMLGTDTWTRKSLPHAQSPESLSRWPWLEEQDGVLFDRKQAQAGDAKASSSRKDVAVSQPPLCYQDVSLITHLCQALGERVLW